VGSYSKLLIVEGHDDRQSVVSLMKSHVNWPEAPDLWPVYVDLGKSVSEILNPKFLSVTFKRQGYNMFGIMLDADDKDPGDRYQSIRNTCLSLFPTLPIALPPEGIIVANTGGMRFGVWIMPDNVSEGLLESFLRYLVPGKQEPVWNLAVGSVDAATKINSGCTAKDYPKAHLYTWLAWQSIPGQQPGKALTKGILNPHSPHAAAFVKWFRELYQL